MTWTPSAANQATVSAAPPRTRSPITTMARGTARRRQPAVQRLGRVGQEQTRRPWIGDPLGLAQQLVPPDPVTTPAVPSDPPVAIRRQQQFLGGAEQEAAAGEVVSACPLAGRGERDGPSAASRRGRERLADGPQGGVGVGVGGGQGAEGGRGLLLPRRSVPHQLLHGQIAGGNRARLVEADHVHPGQGLDCGSSRTSTWRRPRRTTPTAKATLVNSTSSSGTMATVPATAPLSPARSPCSRRSWPTNSSAAVGTSAQVALEDLDDLVAQLERFSEAAACSVSWTA